MWKVLCGFNIKYPPMWVWPRETLGGDSPSKRLRVGAPLRRQPGPPLPEHRTQSQGAGGRGRGRCEGKGWGLREGSFSCNRPKLLLGDFFETFRGFGVLGSVGGRGDPKSCFTENVRGTSREIQRFSMVFWLPMASYPTWRRACF